VPYRLWKRARDYAIFEKRKEEVMSLQELMELSAGEKLYIIEKLWDRLEEKDVRSPDWHRELLEERKRRYEEGKEPLVTLEEFKRQLRR
jgi:putative addiction module component (TIGR02574 family)